MLPVLIFKEDISGKLISSLNINTGSIKIIKLIIGPKTFRTSKKLLILILILIIVRK